MSAPPPLRMEAVALVLGTTRVIDSLSLTIHAGERVAIVGNSGSGKSVIARLATGLLAPTQGTVTLHGETLAGAEREALRALRARCGIVLQGGSLFGDLAVDDNLRLGFGRAGGVGAARLERRVTRLLLDFRIEHLASVPVRALSVGEQRRVELARAFVRDPELVILDEPFEGARADAEQLERKLQNQTRAVLLLTQDVEMAGRLADRVFLIERGRLVQQAMTRSRSAPAS